MATLEQYGTIAIFVALLLAPWGFPVPEDVSLLVMGVLVEKGNATYLEGFLFGYFGVLLGDITVWALGRRVRLKPTGWISRVAGRRRIEWIESFYARWGAWAIIFCRQVPGLRFPGFFIAGATDVSLLRFTVFDGVATLITANLYLLVGAAFAHNLEPVLAWIDRFRYLAGAIFILLAGFLLWPMVRMALGRKDDD